MRPIACLVLVAALSPVAGACTTDDEGPAGGPGADAGAEDSGLTADGAVMDAAADGKNVADGGSRPDSGTIDAGEDIGDTPDADVDAGAPDSGVPDGGADNLAELVRSGQPGISTEPRPAYGALVAANVGERSYVVESRRDVETGPFDLPWRSRFRLAAYDAGVEAWAYAADPDDLIGDVVVHPSGEVTLSLERFPPERMAFDLVRLAPNGSVIGITTLSEPLTVPESDYGIEDPRPLFRMKSDMADATTAGWVRLLADGEGVVAAILSFTDVPLDDPFGRWMALGLTAYDWEGNAYVERWSRIVDGFHGAQPAAWAYDELRQRDQAIRPFLARDDSSGDLLVGRAWNNTRCDANVQTFAEFVLEDCVFGAVSPIENEVIPLAVTRFDATGARMGTRVLRVDEDAAEQVPFALAARNGQLGVAGMVVRRQPNGSERSYDNDTYRDYDGYIAVYDADGQRLRHTDFNLGRGDVLAGMRWTSHGIVAAGSAGWDRWFGGMSISRGADPWFAWLSPDGTQSATRVIPLSSGTRHYNLHDLLVLDDSIIGYGFSDAPMTHSGDGNNTAARTFGPLRIQLTPQ